MSGGQKRFGERLRRYREAAGYSQEELGERAGLSANAISALERGERKRPYPDTIRRIADALELDDAARAELTAVLHDTPPVAEPAGVPAHPAGELPGEPTPFIGREREASVVRLLLSSPDGRLLTLLGPGGVGKTRLALNVARSMAGQFRDGVCWVELASLPEAALVPSTIAHALGLEEPSSRDPVEPLLNWLRERQLLLVLDNLEHLLDAAPVLARLLTGCPELRILATSRSPLRIRGEQEYLVPPLELPPATMPSARDLDRIPSVRFFTWQAQRRNPGFALTTENALLVAEICRRLAGLPLALELVAARMRTLGPAELLARLDRQMPLLVGGARDLPDRQQTMRATIGWSYELLDPGDQALFRQLAVFVGGWTLEAVEVVTRDEDVFDRLGALVDQSLVTVTQEDGETRYGMLEPIRQYALERLEASGEADDARRRHAAHYLELARRAEVGLEGRAEQLAWLQRLEREHDNLRAALAWCESDPDGAETGLRLAAALWRFWEMRWHIAEGLRWLDGALARSDGQALSLRASALTAAGNLARDQGELERATASHEQALAIRRELGETRGVAISLNNLGVIARDLGDAERTLQLCQESLELFREADDQHRAAIALISLGVAAGQQRDFAQGRAWYEESLAIFRASGDTWHTAWVLNYLAGLMVEEGDLASVRPLAEESLLLHRESGDAWGVATALGILGQVNLAGGAVHVAIEQFARAVRLLIKVRVERPTPTAIEHLAAALLANGEPERAAWLAGASAALRASSGLRRLLDPIPVDLGSLRTGPYAEAWQEGRALTREQVLTEVMALVDSLDVPLPAGPPA